jgi:MFS family permease
LTFANEMTLALLLTFTFLLGAGSAFSVPAYQALIPDLVPRSQLPSAASLNSVSINLARAVGPAIGGVLIARTGVAAVFALNAATFLFFGLVVGLRRFPEGSVPQLPERLGSAVLARGTVRPPLDGSSQDFPKSDAVSDSCKCIVGSVAPGRDPEPGSGFRWLRSFAGALGIGAVGGAFLLPGIRARMSSNALLISASFVYAMALVILVLVHSFAVGLIVLVPTGVAWIAVLATVNAMLQLFYRHGFEHADSVSIKWCSTALRR